MRLGIIGYPLQHTMSPLMQEAALHSAGIEGGYHRHPVEPGQVGEMLNELQSAGYRGINVTAPHKLEVMKHLHDIDDGALSAGAVNTVLFEPEKRSGFNTDVSGFRDSFSHLGIDTTEKSYLLIGAGGVARACCCAISLMSPELFAITNRNPEKAVSLAGDFEAHTFDMCELEAQATNFDIVVNATSVDLKLQVVPFMKTDSVFYDINYFFPAFDRPDVRCVSGLYMLVLQGAESFRIWTGTEPDIEAMKKAVGCYDD